MRRIAKFIIGIGVCIVLPAGLAACDKANAGVTQWQGLCIPSKRITSLQDSAFGNAISHMRTDVSTAPAVTVEFSSKGLAQAIKGYVPDIPGKAGTNMGSIVVIRPLEDAAQPGGPAYLSQGAKDLWYLRGMSKDSSVKKIPDTELYRVTAPENQKYDDFFQLVSVDLRKMSGKPVPPLSIWYVADCGQDNELGYTCNRHLFTPDFYVEYDFAKPNVAKLPALDEFFRNKLKEWKAACQSR